MASLKETARGDCLIWIGRSYPTIADFVAEARELGCCRQVPFWPSWLGPGSRVFLAHRGGLSEAEQGVVFGYFKLGGVDVILSPGDYDEYAGCTTPGDKIDFWKKRPRGLPVRPAENGDPLTDFIVDFVLGCEESGRPGFGNGLSTNQTALARARDCGVDGLRRGPELPGGDGHPTFYLVDELAREIASEFCEALKELIKEMLKRERGKTRADCLRELRAEARKELGKHKRQAGLPSFTRAVERVGGRRQTEALVLFPEPYPMFKRAPRASFRGVMRIDGDDLLAQVRALPPGRRGQVRIPRAGAAGPKKEDRHEMPVLHRNVVMSTAPLRR